MSSKGVKNLTEQDRVLWDIIARTVTPHAPVKRHVIRNPVTPTVSEKPEPQGKPTKNSSVASPTKTPTSPAIRQTGRGAMDTQTREKLAKGRLLLEARVDLHGMRQDEAYSLLLSFVARAHARGVRYVLVITGKGSSSGGDGVLRRSVPGWLTTAAFKPYVSAHESAAQGHGGVGALYVRLKRVRS